LNLLRFLNFLHDYIFYLHTKFGDLLQPFGDINAGIENDNGLCDPDHAPFRGVLSSVD